MFLFLCQDKSRRRTTRWFSLIDSRKYSCQIKTRKRSTVERFEWETGSTVETRENFVLCSDSLWLVISDACASRFTFPTRYANERVGRSTSFSRKTYWKTQTLIFVYFPSFKQSTCQSHENSSGNCLTMCFTRKLVFPNKKDSFSDFYNETKWCSSKKRAPNRENILLLIE